MGTVAVLMGLRGSLARLGWVVDLCDETGAAVPRDVNPQPAQGDRQAIAQADQKIDVGQAPDPPSKPSADLQPTEVDDRRAFADGREIAGMPIAKGADSRISAEPRLDGLRDVQTLLLGGRRYSGNRIPVPRIDGCGVADDEDLRMSGDAQIRLDFHPAGVVR